MRFKLYREFGALNSPEIFNAISQGLKKIGHQEVGSGEEIPVIWSVLWKGRMRQNKNIYHGARKRQHPVLIIEVGNLKRGETWRLCLNHINNEGIFANSDHLDPDRPKKLGISLKPLKLNRNKDILICTQLPESLQWEGMPSVDQWLDMKISELRKFTDRNIVIRPHPRHWFRPQTKGVRVEIPKKIPNSYDDFDINFNFHAIINHNSGPTVQSAIHGCPIICDQTGLAYPVSDKIENIEKIALPDREKWFLDLCHREWTASEIATGEPLIKLLEKIS